MSGLEIGEGAVRGREMLALYPQERVSVLSDLLQVASALRVLWPSGHQCIAGEGADDRSKRGEPNLDRFQAFRRVYRVSHEASLTP